MPWAGHWPFLSLSPTQSQRTDAIRHWAFKQPMMTQGFTLGMTLVPSKSRDAGKSPPATLSWQQWVWGSVATIQQQVVNPSRCWVNTCPQSKARRTVRYIFWGGEGVEGGTAFPWFLEPGFIIQPDICPLSYLLWKLSPSPTGCMGVSWPVSSLTSEILCLISSFLPFLSLAFFFFLVQCVGFIKMLPTGLSPNAHKFLFLPEAAEEIAPLSTRHLINNETNSLVCFLSQSFVLSHAV